MLKKIVFENIEELKAHLKKHLPTFYFSSKTSTVIPYDKLEEEYNEKDFVLGDLNRLPKSMQLLEDGNLHIKGPISWTEAREYLQTKGRTILTAPTEELALISAGAATSCTGERCFSFGAFKDQIINITYLDFNGEQKTLESHNDFPNEYSSLKDYSDDYKKFKSFKNAPYPRFEKEIDLMIGTEGQLGIITELTIKTMKIEPVNHLFMLLPKWENDYSAHIEVANKIQAFRDDVILCELIDENSFNYLKPEERPNKNKDAIFFEIKSDSFEKFYEEFLLSLSFLNEEEIFELTQSKFHHLRASIPRAVWEENSKRGVKKLGTDVQVKIEDFSKLLDIYKDFTKLNVEYILFGHFGDAHLHFNFMPTKDQSHLCKSELIKLYKIVNKLNGSPFAEHGIGIIKQDFIKQYWSKNQYSMFKELKEKHDPHNQFFPMGFMNLKE